jgi:cysteine synthase A
VSRHAILSTIGHTPLLSIKNTWIKCEYVNPSGSIKARVAKYLIEAAEADGRLKPGDTIVEATSGNMGNALAMVAAAKNYPMLVLMPHGFSNERLAMSRAYGAQVKLIGDFHLKEAVAEAKALGKQPGYYCTSQFDNPENILENRTWLAPEILAQLPKNVKIDAIVQGVGTGGTLIGVGQAFREIHNPDIKLFAVEPAESPTLQTGEVSIHQIEGISDGFVPEIFARHRHEVTEVIGVDSGEAIACMRGLAKHYGMFVGPSSGANWVAVEQVRQRYPHIRHMLTFFCDEGEKYIQQHFT